MFVGAVLTIGACTGTVADPAPALLGRWRDDYGHEFVFLPDGNGEAYYTPADHLERDPTVVTWRADGEGYRIRLANAHPQTFLATVRGNDLELTPERVTFFTVIIYHRVQRPR